MTPAHIKILGALVVPIILAWVIGSQMRQSDAKRGQQINQIGGHTLVALSFIALFAVASGYFVPGPRGDEGAAAHIFQLAILAVVLVGMLFVSTAKWRGGWLRAARPLVVSAVAVAMAFGMLFYLER